MLGIPRIRVAWQRVRLPFVQGLGVLAFVIAMVVAKWTLVSEVFISSRQSLFLIL